MDEQLEIEEIKKRSTTGVISYLTRTAFLQVITFIAAILVSRFLTPFAFGVYGIVSNFVFLFIFFSDIGLAAALVQKKDKLTDDDLKTTFTIQQLLVGSLVLVIFLLLPFAQTHLKFDNDGLWLGRALAFSLLLASLKSIPSVLLERKLKFNLLVVPEIIETIVFNAVLVILAATGFGTKSFSWAVLLRGLTGLGTIYILSPWKIRIGFDKKVATRLLRFGFPFQLNSVIAWFKDNLLDNVVALILKSPQAFGYLSWAKNFAYQPRKIMDSVIRVSFPVYSRLQARKDFLATALSKTYYFLSFMMFPLMTGICVLAKPFVLYLYGGTKWLPAIPSVWFLSATLIWGLFNSVATNTLSAIGKIKVVLKFMVMVTIVTWLLTPYFTYRFGFNGTSLSLFLAGFVSLWSIKKCLEEIKIDFWVQIRTATLASGMMGIVVYFLGVYWIKNLPELIISVAVGGLIYFGIFFLLEKDRLFLEAESLLGKKLPKFFHRK
jgi:PST family polysaccharide transporter